MKDINLEVFYTEFQNHMKTTTKQHDEIRDRLASVENEVKTLHKVKISQKSFWAVIGLLFTLQLGLYGYLVEQNNKILEKQTVGERNIIQDISKVKEDVSKDISNIKEDVSSIKGKLEPYNIKVSQ